MVDMAGAAQQYIVSKRECPVADASLAAQLGRERGSGGRPVSRHMAAAVVSGMREQVTHGCVGGCVAVNVAMFWSV